MPPYLTADAEAPSLALRLAQQVMSFHRDYPEVKVVQIDIEEKEQIPGGPKYVAIQVHTVPRV